VPFPEKHYLAASDVWWVAMFVSKRTSKRN